MGDCLPTSLYRLLMPYLVANGAVIQCDGGLAPATLVIRRRFAHAGPPIASVVDRTPSSIATFAMCQSMSNPQVVSASTAAGTLAPVPCQSAIPMDWSPGAAHVTVGNPPKGRLTALTNDSTCRCALGGTIRIAEPMTRIRVD